MSKVLLVPLGGQSVDVSAAIAAHAAAADPHPVYTTAAEVSAAIAAANASGFALYDATTVTKDVLGQPSSPTAQEFLTVSGGGQLQVPAGLLAFDNAQVLFEVEGYRRFSAGTDGATGSANHTLTVGVNGTSVFQDTLSSIGYGTGDVPWIIRLKLTRRGNNLDVLVQVAMEAAGSTPPTIGTGGNISGSAAPSWPWGWAYSIAGVDFNAAISLSATLQPPNMSAWTIPTVAPWSGSAATEPMWRWVKKQIDGRMVGIGPAGGGLSAATISANTTLTRAAHQDRQLVCTGAVTLTVDASTDFDPWNGCTVIAAGGIVTLAATGGATLRKVTGDPSTIPQWGVAAIMATSVADEVMVTGRLE